MLGWQRVAEILTLAAKRFVTKAVIVFDVAGFPPGQAIFDVSTQLIISLFEGA